MDVSLILVPTDFTDCALNSLRYARDVAKKNGAQLILLHVIDSREANHFSTYAKEPIEKVLERLTNQAKQAFRRFLKGWDGADIVRETIVAVGSPFQEIAVKARDYQVDLIIMGGYGSRGKGGQIEEIFFGSTVEKVVRLLPCPVLCVPIGWPEEFREI
jgi:nucleotide-binding universal stress UspA family protein